MIGSEAEKMKGRSKIEYRQQEKEALKGIEKIEGREEETTKAKWLRSQTTIHNELGNKLINVAQRMKANSQHRREEEKYEENIRLNQKTMEAYKKTSQAKCEKGESSQNSGPSR